MLNSEHIYRELVRLEKWEKAFQRQWNSNWVPPLWLKRAWVIMTGSRHKPWAGG